MQHTYLRYECADSFGIVTASASSKAPQSNCILGFGSLSKSKPVLLTTAGSHCMGFNLKTASPVIKIGHREEFSGGVGTGRSLNSDQVVCLDVAHREYDGSCRVATGWVDGAVRVFLVESEEINASGGCGLVQTLLEEKSADEGFIMREPLELNGHSGSAVRTVAFDPVNNSRLASGSSDGAVVLWDVVEESGLFRLLGHRGAITDMHFVSLDDGALDCLITSSLDGFVKVWDLKGQCCVQTITLHRGEVWASSCLVESSLPPKLAKDSEDARARLITGGSDGQARVWSISVPRRHATSVEGTDTVAVVEDSSDESIDDCCRFMGTLPVPATMSTSGERASCVHFHPNGKYVGVLHTNGRTVHVYALRSPQESKRKRQRRLARRKEKSKHAESEPMDKGPKRGILDEPEPEEEKEEADIVETQIDHELIKASDEFEYIGSARASHKVKGFEFVPWKESGSVVRLACALTTNAVEVVSLTKGKDKTIESDRVATMDMIGHPTGIRAIELTSDDSLACTISKNSAKIWNVARRTCIQSLSPSIDDRSCYGLCASFLPGNSHLVLGTREGHLLLLDVASGDVVYYEENAHDGAIWSIDVRRPTEQQPTVALVTGSADKLVKFWEIEAQDDDTPMLAHTRTLETSDDVVAVKYSHSTDPTKRMVFVSTLDSTIKVFFDDTLKFFLSLYGHKLPALAVDASDDDAILASSGADKTIKIWGLDFGDTHRTLHGHQDSITDLRFVRRTHNFFTSSKDGTVRYWDGDRFEQILILNGHFAEVSRTGGFVLSAGMDRQVRVWERTKDIVFLEEERERELEKMFDQVDSKNEKSTGELLQGNGDDEAEDAENDEPQSEAAVKKSVLSVAAGDRILEALERADQEMKAIASFRKSAGGKERMPNPMLLSMEPAVYVLWVLKSVRVAELEQSLLVLPLGHVERMLYYLIVLLKNGHGVEICSRVGIFLVKTHQHQIMANHKTLATPLRELRRQLRHRLQESRDVVGFNLAALRAIAKHAASRQDSFIQTDQPHGDIWAGMGLGSDLAAAMEGRKR